jgi:hypothetical protein
MKSHATKTPKLDYYIGHMSLQVETFINPFAVKHTT